MRTIARRPLLLVALLALAGCGGDAPKPARMLDTPQEAVSREGDVTIRANVVRTALLDDTVARGYDIARADDTVLLLVSVRRGPEGRDVAVPAKVAASVTDLQGRTRDIALRELRTSAPGAPEADALVDHVGITRFDAPDTLRFDLAIERDGVRSTMRFTREFSAQ